MLIDHNGWIYISDFGIADKMVTFGLHCRRANGLITVHGSRTALGEDAGPTSDRFALGVSLHEMLTGKLPKRPKWVKASMGILVTSYGHWVLRISVRFVAVATSQSCGGT